VSIWATVPEVGATHATPAKRAAQLLCVPADKKQVSGAD
jgi:hypothetical protein